MSSDVRSLLHNLAFTRELGAADLDRLAELARPLAWQAGQIIFREGDRDDYFYLLLDGRVALEITVPPRGRVRILTVGAGEVFGWSSIYSRKPKTAGAVALEPSRALAFAADQLRTWSDADPRFGYWLTRRLLEVVSARLQATRLQLLDVFKN